MRSPRKSLCALVSHLRTHAGLSKRVAKEVIALIVIHHAMDAKHLSPNDVRVIRCTLAGKMKLLRQNCTITYQDLFPPVQAKPLPLPIIRSITWNDVRHLSNEGLGKGSSTSDSKNKFG